MHPPTGPQAGPVGAPRRTALAYPERLGDSLLLGEVERALTCEATVRRSAPSQPSPEWRRHDGRVSPSDDAAQPRPYLQRRPVLFAASMIVPWVIIVRPTIYQSFLYLTWIVGSLVGERMLKPPVGRYWPLLFSVGIALFVVSWRAAV
jgi:hypothetical protein